MTYPTLTNLSTNVLGDMFKYANTVTDGYFGLGVLITIWLILFLNLMYSGRQKAVQTSLFVCAILAVIFRFLSIVNDQVMIGAVILGGISILFMMFSKEEV